MITCPRCNLAYPEGAPHECGPQQATGRWGPVLWPFLVAVGFMLLTLGLAGSSALIAREPPRDYESLLAMMFLLVVAVGFRLGMTLPVLAILSLGSAVEILVTAWATRPWK